MMLTSSGGSKVLKVKGKQREKRREAGLAYEHAVRIVGDEACEIFRRLWVDL